MKNLLNSIFSQYHGDEIINYHVLTGGICYNTYLLESSSSGKFILQRLKGNESEDFLFSNYHICNSLKSIGWKIPAPILSKSKKPFYRTNNELFVLKEYIEGGDIKKITEENVFLMSRQLAKFHSDLRHIFPKSFESFENIHDFQGIFDSLLEKEAIYQSKNKNILNLYETLMEEYQNITTISETECQIIHGDARWQNFIRLPKTNQSSHTLIDLNSFMKGSIYIDIGDFLRSVSCDFEQVRPQFSTSIIKSVINGYSSYDQNGDFDPKKSIQGGKQIALTLAARFMVDIANDSYFYWNPKIYDSRESQNFARASCQFEIYTKLNEEY